MIEPVQSLTAGTEQAQVQPEPTARAYLTPEERTMVAGAIAGDERALRRFYEKFQSQVRAHLYRVMGPDPDLDDVVQTVFARAFRALDRFEGKSTLATWLYRITANTTHNLLRQRFRRDRVLAALRWVDTSRGATHVRAAGLEARDEATRILQRLRPDLREVFVLYHYEGLTLQEIAEVLDKPVSTIGDRLTRSRKRLRELVAGE